MNNVQSAGLYGKINPFRVMQGFTLGSISLCRVLFWTNDRLDCTLPNDGKYGRRGDVLLHTILIRCPGVVERAQVQAFLLGYLSGQLGLVMVPLTLFTTWSQPAVRDTDNTWRPTLENTHKQPRFFGTHIHAFLNLLRQHFLYFLPSTATLFLFLPTRRRSSLKISRR